MKIFTIFYMCLIHFFFAGIFYIGLVKTMGECAVGRICGMWGKYAGILNRRNAFLKLRFGGGVLFGASADLLILRSALYVMFFLTLKKVQFALPRGA